MTVRQASPFAHLTDEEMEELGREFAAIHEEVYADLGERDRRYITSVIRVHRQLGTAGRALLAGSRPVPTPEHSFATVLCGSSSSRVRKGGEYDVS